MIIDLNYKLFAKPIFISKIRYFEDKIVQITFHLSYLVFIHTRNPALRASKRVRLVAMYIAVAIRPRVLLIQ